MLQHSKGQGTYALICRLEFKVTHPFIEIQDIRHPPVRDHDRHPLDFTRQRESANSPFLNSADTFLDDILHSRSILLISLNWDLITHLDLNVVWDFYWLSLFL